MEPMTKPKSQNLHAGPVRCIACHVFNVSGLAASSPKFRFSSFMREIRFRTAHKATETQAKSTSKAQMGQHFALPSSGCMGCCHAAVTTANSMVLVTTRSPRSAKCCTESESVYNLYISFTYHIIYIYNLHKHIVFIIYIM